eukprot:5277530-Amphidinium_carterae.1
MTRHGTHGLSANSCQLPEAALGVPSRSGLEVVRLEEAAHALKRTGYLPMRPEPLQVHTGGVLPSRTAHSKLRALRPHSSRVYSPAVVSVQLKVGVLPSKHASHASSASSSPWAKWTEHLSLLQGTRVHNVQI